MPKLTDTFSKRISAIIALLRIYRKHGEFETELQQIYTRYRFIVLDFLVQFLEGSPEIKSHKDAIILPESEYHEVITRLKTQIRENNAKYFSLKELEDEKQ